MDPSNITQRKMASIQLPMLVIAISVAAGISQASWVQTSRVTRPSAASQHLTKLHFYFHDTVSGGNATAVNIASRANSTTFGFGALYMIDDRLTVGPDPRSRIIGRAQGMYGEASQTGDDLLMAFTLSFLEGKYNGSSISVMGRYAVDDAQRELPVIGGSGVFRLARGYALAKTYMFNRTTGDATAEYNVFVLLSDTSSML